VTFSTRTLLNEVSWWGWTKWFFRSSSNVNAIDKILYIYIRRIWGARGCVVGWGTVLQAGRSGVRFPIRLLNFVNWPYPSSYTMALGLTQPLREMSTRMIPGDKGRQARKADNLTAVCEPTVLKMWEPRRLTPPWPSRPVTGPGLPIYMFFLFLRDVTTYSYNECASKGRSTVTV
jgi:hypothetical protein